MFVAPKPAHMIRLCLGLVILGGSAVFARSAQPPREIEGQKTPAAAAQVAEQFDDLEDILKRFRTELARTVGAQGAVSPEQLARQAKANKICSVATLPDPQVKLAPEAIYARVRPSVVIVGGIFRGEDDGQWHASCASGFVAHQEGIIITNAHVLEAFRHMEAMGVMTEDGRVFPVKAVLAADAHSDVAVLKIEAKNLSPLPVAPSAPVGSTVYCLSHPELNSADSENGFFAFTRGMVSARFRLRLDGHKPLNVLAITADYGKGSSGGPILNEHGAVVGLVCSTMPVLDDSDGNVQMTWKFSRPSSSILALLSAGSVGKEPDARGMKEPATNPNP